MQDHGLTCPECGNAMELVPGRFDKPYYRCLDWPDCRGSHGAHRDGTPLGTPADKATKTLRRAAHSVFDELWREGWFRTRTHAYQWMQEELGMAPGEAHIGRFDSAVCARLIRAVWALREKGPQAVPRRLAP